MAEGREGGGGGVGERGTGGGGQAVRRAIDFVQHLARH